MVASKEEQDSQVNLIVKKVDFQGCSQRCGDGLKGSPGGATPVVKLRGS
jgi:hypothetical protein